MNPEDPIQPTSQPINQAATPTPQPVQPPIPEPTPEVLPTSATTEQPPAGIVHEIPKKRNSFVIFLIILLILVSLGSLGFWAYQKYFAPSPVASPEPSSQAVVATATPDVTANWKTYTNVKLGFSVQYPPTWKVDNNPETTHVGEQAVALINSGELGPGPGNGAENQFPSHYLGITVIPSKQTIQDYVKLEANGDTQALKDMDQKNLSVGTNEAISFIEPGAGGRGRIGVLSNGKYIFLFAFPYQYNSATDPLPNQILSTFKFTGVVAGSCQATFPVETSVELTASQNYAMECSLKQTKSDCLSMDLYNTKTKDFSKPDGIPDCSWMGQ